MKILPILVLILIFTSCESENPCKNLVNGVYQYPELPAGNNMTAEEKNKFLDIPKDISECITTEGLISSILEHPAWGIIFAYDNGQTGYNVVKSQFNGLGILESRNDRGGALLKKLQEWNPVGFDKSSGDLVIGKYMAKTTYLEILASQYVNLQNLNSSDFKDLFARALEIYDSEKSEIDYYGYFGLGYSATILARMMYLKSYEPFMSLYQSSFIKDLTDLIGRCSSTDIDKIHELAIAYLATLK